MYETFYHLTAKPFSLLPDASFLYPSKRHRKAMNLLEYGSVTEAGFIVITGEVGAGKTTVIRRYLKTVGKDVVVGLITNPTSTFGHLLRWITVSFDIDVTGAQDDAALYDRFVAYLLKQYAQKKRTVLILDEAQNLTAPMLEELRMLSNVNNEKDLLLQIVLVGQPELLDTLNRPELRQFVQRIAVHCHLSPLDPKETAAYIRYRLALVSGSPELFDNEACAAVHFFTGGVPRLINLLCDQALVYGFSDDKPKIDFETVFEVASDRNQTGLSAYTPTPLGFSREMPVFKKYLHEIEEKI